MVRRAVAVLCRAYLVLLEGSRAVVDVHVRALHTLNGLDLRAAPRTAATATARHVMRARAAPPPEPGAVPHAACGTHGYISHTAAQHQMAAACSQEPALPTRWPAMLASLAPPSSLPQ